MAPYAKFAQQDAVAVVPCAGDGVPHTANSGRTASRRARSQGSTPATNSSSVGAGSSKGSGRNWSRGVSVGCGGARVASGGSYAVAAQRVASASSPTGNLPPGGGTGLLRRSAPVLSVVVSGADDASLYPPTSRPQAPGGSVAAKAAAAAAAAAAIQTANDPLGPALLNQRQLGTVSPGPCSKAPVYSDDNGVDERLNGPTAAATARSGGNADLKAERGRHAFEKVYEELSSHRHETQQRFEELKQTSEMLISSEADSRRQMQQLGDGLRLSIEDLEDIRRQQATHETRIGALDSAVAADRETMNTLWREMHQASEALNVALKRGDKAVADELLSKMGELNEKLGLNMQALEDELVKELRGITTRQDGLDTQFAGLTSQMRAKAADDDLVHKEKLWARFDSERAEREKLASRFDESLLAVERQIHNDLDKVRGDCHAAAEKAAEQVRNQCKEEKLWARFDGERAEREKLASRFDESLLAVERQLQNDLEEVRGACHAAAEKAAEQVRDQCKEDFSLQLQDVEQQCKEFGEIARGTAIQHAEISDDVQELRKELASTRDTCNEQLEKGLQSVRDFSSELSAAAVREAVQQTHDALHADVCKMLQEVRGHCGEDLREGLQEMRSACTEMAEAAAEGTAQRLQEVNDEMRRGFQEVRTDCRDLVVEAVREASRELQIACSDELRCNLQDVHAACRDQAADAAEQIVQRLRDKLQEELEQVSAESELSGQLARAAQRVSAATEERLQRLERRLEESVGSHGSGSTLPPQEGQREEQAQREELEEEDEKEEKPLDWSCPGSPQPHCTVITPPETPARHEVVTASREHSYALTTSATTISEMQVEHIVALEQRIDASQETCRQSFERLEVRVEAAEAELQAIPGAVGDARVQQAELRVQVAELRAEFGSRLSAVEGRQAAFDFEPPACAPTEDVLDRIAVIEERLRTVASAPQSHTSKANSLDERLQQCASKLRASSANPHGDEPGVMVVPSESLATLEHRIAALEHRVAAPCSKQPAWNAIPLAGASVGHQPRLQACTGSLSDSPRPAFGPSGASIAAEDNNASLPAGGASDIPERVARLEEQLEAIRAASAHDTEQAQKQFHLLTEQLQPMQGIRRSIASLQEDVLKAQGAADVAYAAATRQPDIEARIEAVLDALRTEGVAGAARAAATSPCDMEQVRSEARAEALRILEERAPELEALRVELLKSSGERRADIDNVRADLRKERSAEIGVIRVDVRQISGRLDDVRADLEQVHEEARSEADCLREELKQQASAISDKCEAVAAETQHQCRKWVDSAMRKLEDLALRTREQLRALTAELRERHPQATGASPSRQDEESERALEERVVGPLHRRVDELAAGCASATRGAASAAEELRDLREEVRELAARQVSCLQDQRFIAAELDRLHEARASLAQTTAYHDGFDASAVSAAPLPQIPEEEAPSESGSVGDDVSCVSCPQSPSPSKSVLCGLQRSPLSSGDASAGLRRGPYPVFELGSPLPSPQAARLQRRSTCDIQRSGDRNYLATSGSGSSVPSLPSNSRRGEGIHVPIGIVTQGIVASRTSSGGARVGQFAGLPAQPRQTADDSGTAPTTTAAESSLSTATPGESAELPQTPAESPQSGAAGGGDNSPISLESPAAPQVAG